jgi:hypothetical protein
VISSSQGLLPVHKHRKTHTYTQTLNIHALGVIRTHDPGIRASEDSACLRPLGYRDRRVKVVTQEKLLFYLYIYSGSPCYLSSSESLTLNRISRSTVPLRKQLISLCPFPRNVYVEDAGTCNITASPEGPIAMASLRALPLIKWKIPLCC